MHASVGCWTASIGGAWPHCFESALQILSGDSEFFREFSLTQSRLSEFKHDLSVRINGRCFRGLTAGACSCKGFAPRPRAVLIASRPESLVDCPEQKSCFD